MTPPPSLPPDAPSGDTPPGQARLIALLFTLAGLLGIAIAADWIHVPDDSFSAPRWVLAVAGIVFIAGGFIPAASRLGTDSAAMRLLAAIIILAMAAIANWVAFGPGERQFSNSVSIGPIGVAGPSSETSGRIAFGIGAVVLDLLILAGAWQWFRSRRE